MATYGPAPGFNEGRAFELWVLNRWVFNFCVRSTHCGVKGRRGRGRKRGRRQRRRKWKGRVRGRGGERGRKRSEEGGGEGERKDKNLFVALSTKETQDLSKDVKKAAQTIKSLKLYS